MARQSDHDLPRTNFPKGFSLGANLMCHEVPECLLVKLFALHTTRFKDTSDANLVCHKVPECLLVKLFALHTTRFNEIFMNQRILKVKKPKVKMPSEMFTDDDGPPPPPEPVVDYLYQDMHIADWILVVLSLLQWLQWMKQCKIPKLQIKKSHCAVQWLMHNMEIISLAK
jgi:hypothetical protein